mgnify:CR=1 FL=1
MKIGVFGGSFNPVHFGHVRVAQAALKELSLDRLIVLPAAVSPFKTGADTVATPSVLADRRLEMVHDAFDALPRTVVDERELRRGGVSYAIDTVREIAAENPGAELVFIIGEDSVAGLPRWKEWDELRTLCSFKAFPRTPESSTAIRALFAGAEVRLNPEEKLVSAVRAGLRRKEGFCPCRLPKSPEFFCPCDEFKGQLADKEFHGLCHCRLYLKP